MKEENGEAKDMTAKFPTFKVDFEAVVNFFTQAEPSAIESFNNLM